MHHVTRNYWLMQQPRAGFYAALHDNTDARQVLEAGNPSFKDFHKQLELVHPAAFANILPAAAAWLLCFIG